MPKWPVRDQWVYLRKMERHSPMKSGQPIEMAVVILNKIILPNSLIRAKNRLVKNGTANLGRNIPTEICGPPPEVIPNIPVRRNRNEPFHLNSDRNCRNLWHNGKHPQFKFPRLIDSWVITLADELAQLSRELVSRIRFIPCNCWAPVHTHPEIFNPLSRVEIK